MATVKTKMTSDEVREFEAFLANQKSGDGKQAKAKKQKSGDGKQAKAKKQKSGEGKQAKAKDSPQLSPKFSPKLSPKFSPKLSPKFSPKLSPKLSPRCSPKATPKSAAYLRKLRKNERKRGVSAAAVDVPESEKESKKQEAIRIIKENCAKPDTKQHPFVPENWVSKFRPALGAYRDFVKSLKDIFVIEGTPDKWDVKLAPARAGKKKKKEEEVAKKSRKKKSPKASPDASPKMSPKASPMATPNAGVVKKVLKKKKKGGK